MNQQDIITLCVLAVATVLMLVMVIIARKQIGNAGEAFLVWLAEICVMISSFFKRLLQRRVS